jgi:hypothetical protein
MSDLRPAARPSPPKPGKISQSIARKPRFKAQPRRATLKAPPRVAPPDTEPK